MSKLDAVRALREARYEKTMARAKAAPKVETADSSVGLCGHRNIGGRTCTREKGHAAKSHRYG